MRAVICHQWGSVDELTVGEAPVPEAAPGEVLIRVKATAVNYADSIMVAGRYQTKPALPFSPGLETAGVVAACGRGVSGFKPGDRVMAILAYGGLAEFAVAPAAETYVIPDGMSFPEAGAFAIAYISSHVAIRWQGRLEAGETLLVLGSAGGVGLAAVEIGKAMGARVIAAASTPEKLAVAVGHGADASIDYSREQLTERVMALTDGKGADICFDPVGGALFDAALSSLGWGGRILLVGFVAGAPDPGEPASGQAPRRAGFLATQDEFRHVVFLQTGDIQVQQLRVPRPARQCNDDVSHRSPPPHLVECSIEHRPGLFPLVAGLELPLPTNAATIFGSSGLISGTSTAAKATISSLGE